MKFILFISRLFFAVLLLSSLSGCKKLIDKIFPGHGNGNPKEHVRIKTLEFTYRAAASGPVTKGIVYYNQHNNPDSIKFDSGLNQDGGDPTNLKTCYFFYNNSNKLIRTHFYRHYGEETHSYTYDGAGKISVDTARILEVGSLYRGISYLTYDNQGRVDKEDTYVYESGGFVHTTPLFYPIDFNYDNNGNLIRNRSPFGEPEPVVYDNKVNYLRTNDIWMFISRNYSKNNPDRAVGYNQLNLPTGFRNGVVFSFLGYGDPYTIEYEQAD